MYLSCILVVLALVGAQSRYITVDDLLTPVWISRVRRDARSAVTINSDGTSGAVAKVPLHRTENNIISAIGGVDLDKNFKLGAATGGIALDNRNGHGLTVTDTHLPGFGDKLAAAGKLNLFHNDNHNLDAKATFTRNMPDHPQARDYNSFGGGLDYMFKDKVGASASVSHTPLFDRNDYSMGGKLNLFHTPDTSIDFNAGFRKFDTPMFNSGWEPNYGFSLTKFF